MQRDHKVNSILYKFFNITTYAQTCLGTNTTKIYKTLLALLTAFCSYEDVVNFREGDKNRRDLNWAFKNQRKMKYYLTKCVHKTSEKKSCFRHSTFLPPPFHLPFHLTISLPAPHYPSLFSLRPTMCINVACISIRKKQCFLKQGYVNMKAKKRWVEFFNKRWCKTIFRHH